MIKKPEFLLAAETSTPTGSVALFSYDQSKSPRPHLIEEVAWHKQQSHSEIIASESENLLKRHKLDFKDIDRYLCGTGPGSFTGIRVALNFIKTLSYVFQKPVHVMNSLKLLALPALQKSESVFCMQSAFRDLFYVSHYQLKNSKIFEEIAPAAWTMGQLNTFNINFGTVTGEAYLQFKNQIKPYQGPVFLEDPTLSPRPMASNFRFHDLTHDGEHEILQWFQVIALYVRASEAEEKLRKGGSNPRDSERGEN